MMFIQATNLGKRNKVKFTFLDVTFDNEWIINE
jgi:hypothetical protein